MKKQLVVLLITFAFLAGCDNRVQKIEIEQTVHNYIVNNPHVLAEAIMNLQKKVADKQQEKVIDLLNQHRNEIDNTTGVPKIGAADFDVTILMFANYADIKSKTMMRIFTQHVNKDNKIRMLIRFLPEKSTVGQRAARIGLALLKQDLFLSFHTKVIQLEGELSNEALTRILQSIKGLDSERLNKDMNSSDVAKALSNDRVLAEKLGIQKSPGYIIGEFLLKQPINSDDVDAVIREIRKHKK